MDFFTTMFSFICCLDRIRSCSWRFKVLWDIIEYQEDRASNMPCIRASPAIRRPRETVMTQSAGIRGRKRAVRIEIARTHFV